MLEELVQGLNVPADVDIKIIWEKLIGHDEEIESLKEKFEKLLNDIYSKIREL